MNDILNRYLDKFMLVSVDDMLVYSRTKEENEEHIATMLQLLYAKLKGC